MSDRRRFGFFLSLSASCPFVIPCGPFRNQTLLLLLFFLPSSLVFISFFFLIGFLLIGGLDWLLLCAICIQAKRVAKADLSLCTRPSPIPSIEPVREEYQRIDFSALLGLRARLPPSSFAVAREALMFSLAQQMD